MASEVDIIVDSGTSFSYHLQWTDSMVSGNPGVDLTTYTAKMDIRRSTIADKKLLSLHGSTLNNDGTSSNSGLTKGGPTGEYVEGATFSGIPAVGGIFLNTTSTGGTGMNGGIRIEIDATSTGYLPSGRHFYDLELTSGTAVSRILQGRVEVIGSITR